MQRSREPRITVETHCGCVLWIAGCVSHVGYCVPLSFTPYRDDGLFHIAGIEVYITTFLMQPRCRETCSVTWRGLKQETPSEKMTCWRGGSAADEVTIQQEPNSLILAECPFRRTDADSNSASRQASLVAGHIGQKTPSRRFANFWVLDIWEGQPHRGCQAHWGKTQRSKSGLFRRGAKSAWRMGIACHCDRMHRVPLPGRWRNAQHG